MNNRLFVRLRKQIRNFVGVQRQRRKLRAVRRIQCNTDALSRNISEVGLQEIFLSRSIDREWPEVDTRLSTLLNAEIYSCGVNPGDRRAIFYLIRHLRPSSVLEVGTHIGASTIYAVAALQKCRLEDQMHPGRLTTVDIIDVNDSQVKPWLQFGSTSSPKDMVDQLGASDRVTFVVGSSLEYLPNCDEKFDFIFLDGDHSAKGVYQEIPAALEVLNQGGVILLHDYFPHLKPLWPDGELIPGPWLGTQRLVSEGTSVNVLPLGELPWATKLNSRVTSLALVVGK